MAARQKKIDVWKIRVEGEEVRADVYLVTDRVGASTYFRAVNAERELDLTNEDINVLQREAEKQLRQTKTNWERWIQYEVECDSDNERLMVKWSIVERAYIGTDNEKHRSFGERWIHKGPPEEGECREHESVSRFCGLMPYSEEIERGLEEIKAGIRLLYDRLSGVLCPGVGADPAKWLRAAAKSGARLLTEGKRGIGKGAEPPAGSDGGTT